VTFEGRSSNAETRSCLQS